MWLKFASDSTAISVSLSSTC